MSKGVPAVLFAVCAVQIVLAIAFFYEMEWATDLWPYPGTTTLTFTLLSSIFAAAGGATLWALLSRNYGALAGIGLDYIAILAPVAVLSFYLGIDDGDGKMVGYGLICVLGVAQGAALTAWALKHPIDRTVPMPAPVRWAFVIYIGVLIIVAVALDQWIRRVSA